MKRIALLLLASAALSSSNAQLLTLSGSAYTQNFNGLASGLPTGWHVFNFATANTVGVPQDTSSKLLLTPAGGTSSGNAWKSTNGGFKNYASANNSATFSPLGSDTAGQKVATDRALGVRQVASNNVNFPGTDSGAAFVLTVANTTGLAAFNMSFKLQSLDSTAGRTTTWRVDYGIGALPMAFTAATATGTLTTGGNTYSNNTINVSFGTGLDNQSGPVWIRVVTLQAASGSGSRTSSAIDDMNLLWTGTGAVSNRPAIVGLTPVPFSTGVPASSNLSITFNRTIAKSTGSIFIRNRTAGTTQTIAASSSNVTVSGKTATITGVTLQNAATYHVTFDSSAFDTAGFKSMGLYDTTAWRFSTQGLGIGSTVSKPTLTIKALNPARGGDFVMFCNMPVPAVICAIVYDGAGREVARQSYSAVKGDNRLRLQAALPAGTYIIRVDDGTAWGSTRVTMH